MMVFQKYWAFLCVCVPVCVALSPFTFEFLYLPLCLSLYVGYVCECACTLCKGKSWLKFTTLLTHGQDGNGTFLEGLC